MGYECAPPGHAFREKACSPLSSLPLLLDGLLQGPTVPVCMGSWDAGLSELKLGKSQANWNEVVTPSVDMQIETGVGMSEAVKNRSSLGPDPMTLV